MNEELNNLKNSGWILTESAIKSFDLNSNTKKNLIKTLLDRDLREIGAGVIDLHKGKFENIDHELVVLQIMKIRNVSAPKANENSKTAPKLLKIQLTDGQNTYSAIEMEPTALTLETKPGTKISLKVKQLKFANGQLLITPKNMEILGGYVEALVSKWELSRSLANQMKGNRSNAAPPFIPFGQKIQQNLPNDKGFKSLQQNKPKEGEEKDNSEFNAQRQDAIAEASKAATRKTFGGGNKTLIDSNVQKIMDKGYTEEQATTALKYANNHVERALQNLKRREERQQQRAGSNEYSSNARENTKDNKRGGGKNAANSNTSDPAPAKPSTGVSLFDFLENKIPEPTSNKPQSSSSHAYNERFENNISSSFRKHDKDNSNKSQWSQYSSSNEHKSSQNYNQKSSYNTRNDYHRNNGENNDRRGEREQYKGDYRKYDRDSRDTPRDSSSRYNHNQQPQQQTSSNYSTKSNAVNSSSSSSYSKPPHSQSMSQKQNMNSQTSSSGANNNFNNSNNGNKFEKGRYGQQQSQKPDYNNSSRGSAPPKEYNSYQKDYSSSGANNSNYSSKYEKPQRANSDMYQKQQHQERRLTESMDKMSLKTNNQSQPSQHHHSYKSSGGYESHDNAKVSSYQHQSSSTSNESKQNYSKNQSNYPIVGFQNKEANEQAKNALKTKNIPGAPKWQQQQQQVPPPQAVPIQMMPQTHSKPPAPFANSSSGPPMHTLQPQPFVQHPVPAAVMHHPMPTAVITTANPPPTAVFHAAPITYQTPIIMQSVQATPIQVASPATPAGIQQMKIGDLCLAKYWEDGKFYNAKITGISESTYVVLFTDYGNAEEVRKNDCVPLIMPSCPTPPQPITNFVQPPPQMGSYRISSQQQQQHSYHSQQQSMPYKGKQQRRN